MAKKLTDKQKSMLGSAVTGLTGGIGLGTSLAQIEDTSADESFIENVGSTQFSSGDTNALLSSFNNNSLARTNYTADEIRGFSDGQLAGSILASTASGAVSGATKGGWIGALVEGGANLIGGTIGALAGNRKAENKANELNKLAEEANKQYLNNFANAASNTQNKMFNNSLLNIAAYGGLLDNDEQKTDWDTTLPGQLINYTENRDSLGFDYGTRRWYEAAQKGTDPDNRGMGLDINYLNDSSILKKDSKGKYITEADERAARYEKLNEVEKSYNQRLKYAQKVTGVNTTPSEYKKALVMDAIYNFGVGDVANIVFEDRALMNTLMKGSDEQFKKEIQKYWDANSGKAIKKRADRINKQNEFFEMNNKAYGGPLFNHSGDWSNGLTFIDEGGTHSENPLGGVPVGIDPEGTPNLVEEGEIIWNDYVFSNRLKPTKKQLETVGYNNKYDNWTFAKIVEDVQKISAETPVDKISTDTLNDNLMQLVTMQEEIRMKKEKKEANKFSKGGNILADGDYLKYDNSQGFKYYKDGIYNPGYLNWLNNLSLEKDKDILTELNTYYNTALNEDTQVDESFLNLTKRLGQDKKFGEFHKKLGDIYSNTLLSNEDLKNSDFFTDKVNGILTDPFTFKNDNTISLKKDKEGKYYLSSNYLADPTIYKDDNEENGEENGEEEGIKNNLLRYASPLAHGLTLLNNLQKPDYSDEKALMKRANNVTRGSYTPLGNILDLDLIDKNVYTNPILANAAANRRAIMQNSTNAGSANAALLVNNYLTNTALGEADIQGIQTNNEIKSKIAQFNLTRDQANSQMGLQALSMDQQADQLGLNTMANAVQSMNAKNNMRSQAISSSLTGMTTDLGNIGREAIDRAQFNNMIDQGIIHPGYTDIWTTRNNKSTTETTNGKNGGLLTRNKRRRK